MKSFLPPLLLVLILVFGGCAKPPTRPDAGIAPATIPDSDNPNREELRAFAQAYAEGTEEARAAAFLLENLPPADRLSMKAADLRENLDHAFLARRVLPWGQKVPWDMFLHYVLPHRASQEPFEPYRAMLFRELAPLCATAGSMEEALVKVGSWCAAKAEYRPTSRRDLSVRSILDAGYGRCEETNILFLAAARAVGLPVRQAMVPWWQHGDGNHAWVEAWTEKGWRYLESGTEFLALNRTWFTAQAPRMPKVANQVYGHPRDPLVYRTGPGFALVDNTAAYAPATSVRLSVTMANTQPAPSLDVFFAVYSLGGLRPVTKAVTDARGESTIILGPGIFFVSCAAKNGLNWTLLDTRDTDTATIHLHADTPLPLPASLAFAFPEQAADTFTATPSAELLRIREERSKRWEPVLQGIASPLRERLLLAGERVPGWLRLMLQTPGPATPWILPLLEELDDKDLLQVDPSALPVHIDLAVQARQATRETGLSYDDEVFQHFVLSPRIHLEPWSPWRAELWPWLGRFRTQPLEKKVSVIRQRLDTLQTLTPALFGPPLTPGQVHAGGYCSSKTDKIVLATAALRTLGIAARCQPDFGGVDYFDGRDWLFWKIQARPEASGTLRVMGDANPQPFLDFGVARIEDGQMHALDDLTWQADPGGLYCVMQAGDYLLLTAKRSGTKTTVHLRPFTITAATRTEVMLAAGVP